MPSLLVTYGIDAKGMAVRVIGQSAAEFKGSVPWRAGMFKARASLQATTNDALVFSADLNYRQCLEIAESLESGIQFGVDVDWDDSFQRFIDMSQTYIENRSHIGLAIKSKDPSVENEYQTFKRIVSPVLTRQLREKQMRDAFFMATMRWSGNFSVPGSGKTASVLGAFSFLRQLGKVKRIIVVCPKSAFESWRHEWIATIGDKLPLKCFCLADPEIARLPKARKQSAVRYDCDRYNLMLFNYESLGGYVKELKEIIPDQTLLVFDEVHRVKAYQGTYASWALAVAKHAGYVTVLTGTPIPNTYLDIYNMLHLLYPDDYDTFFGFMPGFLKNPTSWEIDRINEAVRPFFCRTNKDELGVPRPNEDSINALPASEAENILFNILKAAYRKNHLVFMIRALQLESDAQMLKQKIDPADYEYVLDQVGEDITDIGFVDYSDEVPALIEACQQSTKMEACIGLVSRLVAEGKPVIVWCIFVKSIENITAKLCSMCIPAVSITGSTPMEVRENTLEDFRNGVFKVLVTNPHTLAESVSLHQLCHDGVYYEYSYNLVHLLQSKDRIHRLGLPKEQYTQYHFLVDEFITEDGPFSLDQRIYDRLREKEKTMLEAIDGGYLERGYVDEEDLEIVLGDLFH